MQIIDWTSLHFTDADATELDRLLTGAVHLRLLRQAIVRLILEQYPWGNRADLLPLFDPCQQYDIGRRVGVAVLDEQGLRPDAWHVATVEKVTRGENPVQGTFQVVTLNVAGRKIEYAANISNATPLVLRLTSDDPDRVETLVSYFADEFADSLDAAVKHLIDSGRLKAELIGDYLLARDASSSTDNGGISILKDRFSEIGLDRPWLETDVLLGELSKTGWLTEIDASTRKIILRRVLQQGGYLHLGEDRWTTQALFDAINRPVDLRLPVPRVRSHIVLPFQSEDDVADSRESDLPEDAKMVLRDWPELEKAKDLGAGSEWHPLSQSEAIRLPTLSYLHITQGYFPLAGISRAFHPDLRIAQVQIAVGDRLPFLIDRDQILLKAVDAEAFYEKFRYSEPPIPAGTHLWLEYQGGANYRIAPRPLSQPQMVPCKVARIEDGRLLIESADIEMRFEGDPQRFKADLRFEDIEALYEEARRANLSVRDATVEVVKGITETDPRGQAHYTEIFNAVFLKRMCSPSSVIWQLYNHSCFVKVQNGYFRFDPKRGFFRKPQPKPATRPAIENPAQQDVTHDTSETAPAYFIFQQRPESEYADRPGKIYNWTQGIPGSNQIMEGAQFVYYRPGDKVFFGSGRIARIKRLDKGQGRIDFDGQIDDYAEWKPPLGLSEKLFRTLEIYDPKRIWIGQAGIRAISSHDFKAIVSAYRHQTEMSSQESAAPADSGIAKEGAQAGLWAEIGLLTGRTLRTLSERAEFAVQAVDLTAVRINVLSTGTQYSIYREELEQVWDVLNERKTLAQTAIRNELGKPNPTYVAAILAALPGVNSRTDPIRLIISGGADRRELVPEEPQPLQAKLEITRSGQTVAPGLLPAEPLFIASSGQTEQPGVAQPVPAIEAGIETPNREPAELPPELADLRHYAGHTLHTLQFVLPFRVEDLSDDALVLRVSGEGRNIPSSELITAWQQLAATGEYAFKEEFNRQPANSAFIAAVLSTLPGITCDKELSQLRFSAQEAPTPEIAQDSAGTAYHKVERLLREKFGVHLVPGTKALWQVGNVYVFDPYSSGNSFFVNAAYAKRCHGQDSRLLIAFIQGGFKRVYVVPFELLEQNHIWDATRTLGTSAWQVRIGNGHFLSYWAGTQSVRIDLSPYLNNYDLIAEAIERDKEFREPGRGTTSPSIIQSQNEAKSRPDMQTKTLFSRHYLDQRLPLDPEWQKDPSGIFDALRALWQKARQAGEMWNEAQTEDEFVKPALEALGWSFIVQPKSWRQGQVTRPDYALFADVAAKNTAYKHQGNDDAFYSRALAIAEAKHWGRPLNQKDASGRTTWKAESNPSHQMVSYLVGTRTDWGILTNGRIWRLYSREVSSTASEFYEIDLGLIFEFLPDGIEPTAEQLDQFKRWWLFFRRQAFTTDAAGKSFIQQVHEGSTTYAREISDKLKELVFQDVMPEIAGGFVSYRHHQLQVSETPETLAEIYQASLSLLYKLLFLLYAEARGLLPMDNPGYQRESLTELSRWSAEQFDRASPLSTSTYATPRYEALLALFKRIDVGDSSMGIPHYDGGLFSPKSPENQFLEKHKLSDHAVAKAVDVLVRDAGQPVDYAYISVRNLGAIYEGLLENKLRVEDAASGKVVLINDKGERKATGSYYTPDYIVEYIVQNALDPVIDARTADYANGMEMVANLRRKLATTIDPATNRLLQGQLLDAEQQAREAFLGIKVLDPAMGSGHFLVNAVDHLTDGIIQRMQVWHDGHPNVLWDWDPIQQLIERVRNEVLQEMQSQGLQLDAERLDDTAILTRLVMKRCIYGVDLNRMAVELAKVSLWLHSFTVGAPLSFLDHHLRWGNSLLGTDVRTVENSIAVKTQEVRLSKRAKDLAKGRGETPRESIVNIQSSLFGGPFAGLLDLTAQMIQVAERADATLADVRESSQAYEQLQKELVPYKQALNLWVSQYFGNKTAKEFMELYGADVLPAIRGEVKVAAQFRACLDNAQKLWGRKRFFHWDLEFPEVFVDLRKRDWAQNPGFDVVLGNPPYDELSEVASGGPIDEMIFLQNVASYKDAITYRINLYRLFIACAVDKTATNGSQGFIVPMSLLGDRFTFELRRKLLSETVFRVIEAFPQKDDPRKRVFEDAKLPTCVYVLSRGQTGSPFRVRIHPGKELEDDSPTYYATSADIQDFDPENLTIPVLGEAEWAVARKLGHSAKLCRLGEVAHPMSGEVVFNEQFREYLSENPEDTLVLRGGHVQRYDLLDDPKQGTPVYIDLKRWMSAAKEGSSAFAHKKARVVYQESAALDNWRRIIATYLPEGNVCGHKISYFVDVRYSELALLAIFNSRVVEWRFGLVSATNSLSAYQISAIPVPRINFTTPTQIRAEELVKAQTLYEMGLSKPFLGDFRVSGNFEEVIKSVWQWLAYTPEQADLVHDLLAHLAGQMIEMNKVRRSEMRGFLTWLGRQIGADVDDLTGKTTLLNYLGDYQKGENHSPLADVLAILQKNQKSLNIDVSDRVFGERLAKEYQASLDKLLPIKARLAATDRLIDRIVYTLYDLTDDEIRIVEGKNSA